MKKEFVKPEIEVVEIDNSCVLCASCPPVQGGGGEDGGCMGQED